MDFPSYWPSTWSTVLVYKPRILSCTVHVLLYRYILILYWFCRSLAVVVDWLSTACWLHDWLLARNWFARICMVVCRPHTAQQTPCSSDISDSGRTCAVEFMRVRDFSYCLDFPQCSYLSVFSSVFFICLDFPQCFISCSILSAIFLSVLFLLSGIFHFACARIRTRALLNIRRTP